MEGKNNQIIIYNTEDGQTKIEVKVQDETVWLSQKQMAGLFDKDVRTVNEHVMNIYDEAELSQNSTIRKFRIVQKDGNRDVSRDIDFYNLDVIISVGYRVKSHRGTQFRIWATQKLKEYIIKGFVMDDERLADGRVKKHILRNGKKELGGLEPRRPIFTKKSEMFLRPVLIIIQSLIMLKCFLRQCKINFITPLLA